MKRRSKRSTKTPRSSWRAFVRSTVTGHLRGTVRNEAGVVVDTGLIQVTQDETAVPGGPGRTSVASATDGNGYYGGVDLAPGTYRVTVAPAGQAPFTGCSVTVTAGAASTLDMTIDRDAPATTITADPAVIWPPNGQSVQVTVSGTATDVGTGVSWITFRVIDEYGEDEPETPVASIAACVQPWERSQSASSNSPRVVVANVLSWYSTVRPVASRTHATTVVAWTSNPAHR
ncbi:hypothetical protein BH23ACI1_BH23ACI1_17470 [soil metagenome]